MYTHVPFVLLALVFSITNGQLHTVAKQKGLLYFGTETDNGSLDDKRYQVILKNTSDFGQITPGNSLKWDAIEPAPGDFTFAAGDAILALAKANSQIVRCHNLVWHQQLPTWVTGGNWTVATLIAALQNHITNEVTHYKGQCYAWDVVNEALNSDGTFQSDVFFRVLGSDYIRIAFAAAAAADPNAKLYYNDFGIEMPGVKSAGARSIVRMLKAAGVKIDGVGFQSHFVVGSTPSKALQVANLKSFTALGVEVALTELDVRMTLPSTPMKLLQQKADYQSSTAACMAVSGCVGITVWDFDDKYSWVPAAFNGTGAACLFDALLDKKPAYAGALAGLATGIASNSTNAALATSSNTTSSTTSTADSSAATSTCKSNSTHHIPDRFGGRNDAASLQSLNFLPALLLSMFVVLF